MEQKQIQIKAKDEDIKGVYSNLMQIVHTKEEFILDFFLASPPQGILSSRVIMSPGHIKRMLKALQENLAKYEDKFGKIEEAKGPEVPEEGEGKIGFRV
ncbi:DUF3467 domain-containing protein [Candidatus Parcubacteria bacterium]|nr:DUF3467 domain-containing protein [Candidatus Parcubacteria bacterium]